MPISLYDAVVPSNLQILGAVVGLVDKAEAFCAESGTAPESVISCSLFEDMLPFSYQVKWTATHSLGAIEGVRSGRFGPDMAPPPTSFAELKATVQSAIDGLKQVTADELEGYMGKTVNFSVPNVMSMDFTAENFLLSFSQPNFYFHATTAYNILRNKGVAVGKRDFMGAARIIMPA